SQLLAEARERRRRFDEAFWVERESCYAFGLDPDKRRIETVASNVGHCLWSGIVAPEKAAQVGARLLAPDMWSGWGVRTLSANNPAYNPFSYQRGSVWPHDNGILVAGPEAPPIAARGQPRGSGDLRRGQLLRELPHPRALRRLRADSRLVPGPVPGRKHSAGLGGRSDLPHAPEHSRSRGRRPPRASVRHTDLARLAAGRGAGQPQGRRRASHAPLRARGGRVAVGRGGPGRRGAGGAAGAGAAAA